MATLTSPTVAAVAAALLAPAFPLSSDFANAARWTRDRSGLWVLAQNTNADVADVKTNYAQLGGASLANASALTSASYSGGVLTWVMTGAQDWSTSGGTSALAYWTIPSAGLMDDASVVAWRVVSPAGLAEGAYIGVLIADDSAPTTTYIRMVAGYISGGYAGYSQIAGSFGTGAGNFTLNEATQTAGVWFRVVMTQNGTAVMQYSTSSASTYDEAAATGTWTTVRTASSAGFTIGSTLRVGVFGGRGATATVLTLTLRSLTVRSRARGLGRDDLLGFGLPRSRSVTAIPILTANIGASATYSDAEIIARLARAVNKSPFDTATVRAYIQRGSDYAVPSDGAGGWVTYSGGTFSGLATTGTGAKLSIWLDAASTNGAQPVSFDPTLFGALGVS